MPAGSTWVYTPNKVDHLIKGFTSKAIYEFHSPEGVEVADSNDVFTALNSSGNNIKGSYHLPANYFYKIDDGRGFKITMYFSKLLDGNDMAFNQSLIDGATELVIASETYTTPTDNLGGSTLAKYQCHLTKFYNTGNSVDYVQATGDIVYSRRGDGTAVCMTPFNGVVDINPTHALDFYILNRCTASIFVKYLLIEEIS